jgi:predicted nucleic acid-binding protein
MPDTEGARLIISAARRDLQALENMLDSHSFPSEIFGFHAQQAVEKALKAWLVLLDQECPRTHNIRLVSDDYERAAEFFNICRQKGVQGSNTDFLLCAVSARNHMPVLTTDADFKLFQRHIPIILHQPRIY